MTTGSPRVSVLMSVYNGERYLRPAIESMLGQDLEDFEFVIVDDASTDTTSDIVSGYARLDGRIRAIRNEKNLNAAGARNRGLSVCRAPLVAVADSDDIYAPNRLSKQAAFMDAHPDVGVLSSNVRTVDSDGNVLGTSDLPLVHEAIRFQMNYTFPLRHPATMIRRHLLVENNGYNEEAVTAHDVELCGRLVRQTRFANLPERLVDWRRHETSNYSTRGSIGIGFSLRTRTSLLCEYLGEDVKPDEADSLHALLQKRSSVHEKDVIERGLDLAMRLNDELRRRNLNTIRLRFEQDMFDALCSQSIKHSRTDGALGRRLLVRAISVSPVQMVRTAGLRKIAAMIRG